MKPFGLQRLKKFIRQIEIFNSLSIAIKDGLLLRIILIRYRATSIKEAKASLSTSYKKRKTILPLYFLAE